MTAHPRDPEALLAHAGWMRALALALVGNPDDADDLVQDVQLAALLRPPPPEAAARAWFTTVVKNLAGKRRRARTHRADREERATRPEGEPSPADTLERLDLQRVLLEAVRGLDEPFRGTIVARYFEGRTSADIARRAGVPAGTVRWRLKRGLELLRARLDAEHPRASWAALLAPLARFEPAAVAPAAPLAVSSAAATVLLPGVFTVSLLKLGLPLALVSIVGFAWWQLADAPAREPLQARAEPARDAVLASPAEPRSVAVEAERTAPAAPAAASEPATPDAGAAAMAAALFAPRSGRIEVRFVDAQSVPWADVELQALHLGRKGEPLTAGPVVTSGADGRAELEVDFPRWGKAECRFDFLARRPTLARKKLDAVLRAGELVQLGDVVLGPPARVSGRVLDASGLAVAGARVGTCPDAAVDLGDEASREKLARLGCAAFDSDLSVVTAADGSFVLEDAEPGRRRIWAHAAERRYAWTEPLELDAERELTGVELVLAPLVRTDRIMGRVLDPEGQPCWASLMCLERIGPHGSGKTLMTDEAGRFEILVSDTRAVFELTASAHDFPSVTVRDVRPGDHDVEIHFVPARALLLGVHDPEGNPLAGVEVRIHLTGMAEGAQLATRGPGEYSVTCPGEEFRLEVEAPGHRPASEGPFASGPLPARLDVVLERSPRVRGRVVAGGAPLAGASVELRYYNERGTMTVAGLRCVSSPFVESQSTSDAEGRFELELVQDKPFLVRASHADWAVGETVPYAPSAVARAEGFSVEVELTAGGTLEGSLRSASGERVDGRFVVVHHGDGAPLCSRTDRDGRYRFDRLAPGPWLVVVRDEELDPNTKRYGGYRGDAPLEWSCTVEPGRTTRFDPDVP